MSKVPYYYNSIDAQWIRTNKFNISDLHKAVDFGKNITLNDLMFFISTIVVGDEMEKLFDAIFNSPFKMYFEAMCEPPDNKDPQFEKIVFEMVFEKTRHGKGYSSWNVYAQKTGDRKKYAVDFLPLRCLRSCSIRVSDRIRFYDYAKRKIWYKKLTHEITLFDLIYNLFFQFVRFGSQEEKDDLIKTLKRRYADVKSRKVKAIPAKEVFRRIRETFSDKKG